MSSVSWQAVTDFYPEPIMILNQTLHVAYCNPAFEVVFGWDRGEYISRSFDMGFPEQDRATVTKIEQLSPNAPIYDYRTRHLTKTGKPVEVILAAERLPDKQGQPVGIIIMMRLFHLADDQVVHHLSHELKTPLAVLSASIRLLEKGVACASDPRWQRIHERIERNLNRLLELEYKLEDILRAGDDGRTENGNA